MNDAPCALVGTDPVSDLDNAELEQADVDYVAFAVVELDALTHSEWFSCLDENETGHVGDHNTSFVEKPNTPNRKRCKANEWYGVIFGLEF
jgi:hypothetical protein